MNFLPAEDLFQTALRVSLIGWLEFFLRAGHTRRNRGFKMEERQHECDTTPGAFNFSLSVPATIPR